MALGNESEPLRVFVVARSASTRRRIRALLERGGAIVAGEAPRIEDASSDVDAILVDDAHVAEDGAREPLVEPLTPRERQVLEHLAEGLSNREIAARLGISEHTVKFHVSAIYGKLGAASRAEAVRHGLRHGLITL